MRIALLSVALLLAFSFAEKSKRIKLPEELQGDIIPYFFVLEKDGSTFYRDDFRENAKPSTKRIVLSFFAKHCEFCWEEFAVLKKNATELENRGVQIYLIDIGDEDFDKVIKLVKKYAADAFPIFFDPAGEEMLKMFGLKNILPTIIVLDADLKVLSVFVGKMGSDFPQLLWGKF